MSGPITISDINSALPDLRSTVPLRELYSPVDIYRDQWGIPHIQAGNEQDAFFAQGFATAQDRLWQMDSDRHRALGRWATLVGENGLDEGAVGISGDRLLRRLGIRNAARADYEVSSPNARSMLDSYAAGVNAFIETTKVLPIEYSLLEIRPDAWEPWQCLAVYKVRNMLMGTFEMKVWRAKLSATLGASEAARLHSGYQSGHLITVPPGQEWMGSELNGLEELIVAARDLNWLGETDAGSNSWVIGGDRTVSGLPLVAGDSHRGLDTPNVYYQIHITCPEWSVSGFSVPGMPGAPHFSHTEFCAFGMTHGNADYQDLYVEKFREQCGRREYLYQDNWIPAHVSRERLEIRGGRNESIEVTTTHHGPVVAGEPSNGFGLAFSHTGTRNGTPWADSVYGILHAKDADQLEQTLKEWTEPVNNFTYADVYGNFGYRLRGRIPIRSMANAWRPVPGWTGEHEWNGKIPFEEMPHVRNPDPGYVVTCNQRVTDELYPYYIGLDYAPEYRARRVTDRLNQIPYGEASVNHMSDIHAERLSIPAKVFKEVMKDLSVPGGIPSEALSAFLEWDCRMDKDAVGATVYAATRNQVVLTVTSRLLGSLASSAIHARGRGASLDVSFLASKMVTAMARNDRSMLGSCESWESVIQDGFGDAVSDLSQRLGSDVSNWKWGNIHRTNPRHPLSDLFPESMFLLNPRSVDAHGDGDTPLAGSFPIGDPFLLSGMSVNRYIHDPSNWRNSRWVVPLGSSGHPGSPHYDDQAGIWSKVQSVPQLWDWNQIKREAESFQRLIPMPK